MIDCKLCDPQANSKAISSFLTVNFVGNIHRISFTLVMWMLVYACIINCTGMTKWISGWKKNNWKLSTGGPVKNEEELRELDLLCCRLDIIWVRSACYWILKLDYSFSLDNSHENMETSHE